MKSVAKILPHSIEAEQAVLGCVLIDENVPLNIFALVRVDDFYSEEHRIIYKYMLENYTENKPVDFVTLTSKLESAGSLEKVGGLSYITSLTNIVPSAANYRHYADIVKNHSRLRSLAATGRKIIEKSYEEQNGKEALMFAEKLIFDLSERDDNSSLEHIDKGLKKVIDKFDMIAKDKNCLLGIPTNFKRFDQITNGLQNSDLILLAARPGVGKTSLGMNMLNNAAIYHGKSCAIFSLEMPTPQLVQRSLCGIACVSMQKALNGSLNEEEWHRIWQANKQLSEAKIYIDDSSLNTPMDILSKCRRLKREKGLDIVMIDYLQLMKSGLKQDNRVLEIAEITRSLKIAAKELNVPIILLSQLSRMVETRKDHRPMLSDLRDSGAIEQDADLVLFIYKPDMYNDVINEDGEGICEIEIAKHRNGATGRIKVRWIGEWVSFVDIDAKINLPKQTRKTIEETGNKNSERTAEAEEIMALEEISEEPTNSPE
ncbi:MAG: replicative DNA helicase [Clostridia bacterium]|nr:replicative DNA helicase [Clostridia bacterium]MDD4686179.1 replicative DNA helicase [Clostridia bacterium]